MIFIDTGAWIALAVKRDQYHNPAARYYKKISKQRILLLTTNYVLQETYTRIRYGDTHTKALQFHDIITETIDKGRLKVEWITPQVHEEAWNIFRDYSDQNFSFVDCTSFIVAKKMNVISVFGFDSSFNVFGLNLEPSWGIRR